MRIDKYLAHNQFGSRNDVKKILKDKLVYVNDELVTKASYQVNLDKDIVTVNDEVIEYLEKFYVMINKPTGYICSHHSNLYPSVLELLPFDPDNTIMVGRLDVDTEGLLLITNDGQFSHRIAHGKKDISKTYFVKLRDDFNKKYIDIFKEGILMDESILKPAETEVLSNDTLLLTISEGKYHQVKRMMHYADNEVIYLKRMNIGKLQLDEHLELGAYRHLTDEEIAYFD